MENTRFVAIDVETANNKRGSICQIGIACYENGQIAQEWESLVNPEDIFWDLNIDIHGIKEHHVKDSPTFPMLKNKLFSFLNTHLENQIVVSHSNFDKSAISQVCEKYIFALPNCKWIDSIKIAKDAWPELVNDGYGHSVICDFLNYKFKHHDALADAEACGYLTLKA